MSLKTTVVAASLLAAAQAPLYAAENTDLEALNQAFSEALAMRDSGDLFGAIEALQALIASAPEFQRARLELAVAYYRAALFEDARRNAEAVLNDPTTPPQVKETVQLFLTRVTQLEEAAAATRHTFSRRFSFGIGHDSNVNAGPSADVIDINGATFALTPGSTERGAAFANAALQLDHVYRIPGSIAVGKGTASVQWRSGASLYRRVYRDESEFNLDVVSLNTGPAFLSSGAWRAQLRTQFDYLRLGGDKLGHYIGINPSISFVQGRTEYTLDGSLTRREYSRSQDVNKTGNRYGLGLGVTHRLDKEWVLQGGVSLARQDAKVDYETYLSRSVNAGAVWYGWADGSVFGRVSYRVSDHDGQEPLFGVSREDKVKQVTLGATQSLRSGPLDKWRLTGRVSYTDAGSNVGIYDYRRTELYAELGRAF